MVIVRINRNPITLLGPRNTARQHDIAAPLPEEIVDRNAARENSALEISVDLAHRRLPRDIRIDRVGVQGNDDTGITHRDIDTTELSLGGIREGQLDCVGCSVAVGVEGILAADLGDEGLRGAVVQVAECDFGAVGEKLLDFRAADSRCTTY